MRVTAKTILFMMGLILVLISMKSYEAARILGEEEEQWIVEGHNLLLQSLKGRRLARTPSPDGCTWIPGGPPCRAASIGEQNFPGSLVATPPPIRRG